MTLRCRIRGTAPSRNGKSNCVRRTSPLWGGVGNKANNTCDRQACGAQELQGSVLVNTWDQCRYSRPGPVR